MHEFDYTGKPRSGLFFVAAVEECTNVTSFCELEPAKKWAVLMTHSFSRMSM
jgi:hypothetical protein